MNRAVRKMVYAVHPLDDAEIELAVIDASDEFPFIRPKGSRKCEL